MPRQVAGRGVDEIAGHHPVRRELAAGDRGQPGRDGADRVLAAEPGGVPGVRRGHQGPQAGEDPLDIGVGQRAAQHAVDLGQQVVDVSAARRGPARVVRPLGVGVADDPVIAPRDHEQHALLGPGEQTGVHLDAAARDHDVHALGRPDPKVSPPVRPVLFVPPARVGPAPAGPGSCREHDMPGADREVRSLEQVARGHAGDP